MGNLFSVKNYPPPITLYYPAMEASLPALPGKIVAITGCTSGTGLVLAKLAASKGCVVILLNRPSERAKKALESVKAAGASACHHIDTDLTTLVSVKSAAAQLKQLCPDGIDVLVNNAGVMGLHDAATEDGYDVQMQTNHLSHFLLVSELWGLLEKRAGAVGEARVVNHSSGARKKPWKPMTAAYIQKNGGNLGGDGFPGLGKWQRYQQSKLANLLFTYELAAFAEKAGSKVKALCAHPGPCDSGLQAKTGASNGKMRMVDNVIMNMTLAAAQSVEDGSLGIIRAALEPGLGNGEFYGPAPAPDGKGGATTGPAVSLASERDAEAQALLWYESMKECGIKEFGVCT